MELGRDDGHLKGNGENRDLFVERPKLESSIAQYPPSIHNILVCARKCIFCNCNKSQSDDEHDLMIRIAPLPPCHTTDIYIHLSCGKILASYLTRFKTMNDYEIMSKFDVETNYGTGGDIIEAFSRCQSYVSRDGGEEKEYFLVKEFERHLEMVQSLDAHVSNCDFATTCNQRLAEKKSEKRIDDVTCQNIATHNQSSGNAVQTQQQHEKNQDIHSLSEKVRKQNQLDLQYTKSLSYANNSSYIRVPTNFTQTVSLGNWLQAHRTSYYKRQETALSASLTKSKIGILNNTASELEHMNYIWEGRYKELEHFIKHSGHARVPKNYHKNPPLANWVNVQRTKYKKFQNGDASSNISREQIDLLNEVGFEWECPNKLQAHRKTCYNKQGTDLSASLTTNKIGILNNIGHKKEYIENIWDTRYKELVSFVKHSGHARVPKNYHKNLPLANWVDVQRKKYEKIQNGDASSNINRDQIGLLNKVGFEWQRLNEWDRRYKELATYVKLSSDRSVPSRFPNSHTLDRWVCAQRANYEKFQDGDLSSSITEDQIALLNKLGFDWGCSWNEKWDRTYEELLSFARVHGHARVPNRCPERPSLCKWARDQRANYTKFQDGNYSSCMTKHRVQLLNKVGFEWKYFQTKWDVRYKELTSFVEDFGHARVPFRFSHNPSLGQWVSVQRKSYKKFQKGVSSPCMTVERVELLSKIGFEWECLTKK